MPLTHSDPEAAPPHGYTGLTMTVTNDPIIFVDDVLEFARETLQRFERGELRAYAFRVFMKDGSYQDFVGGCTEEDQQRARADMLKRFDCEVET